MGILVYYGPVAGPLQAAAQVQAVLGQQALPASHHSSQVKSEYQSCLFSDLLWCGNWSRTEKKKGMKPYVKQKFQCKTIYIHYQ